MKTILISALALGAMTSIAFAEAPLTPIAAQPMQLSLAQLDGVTAGGNKYWKKKRNHKPNKVEIDIDVDVDIDQKIDVVCKNCKVTVNNNVEVEVEL
jgi:hypothetical protein